MYEELDRAIDILAKRIIPAVTADDALKYTQAALNLAHTKLALIGAPEPKETGKRQASK